LHGKSFDGSAVGAFGLGSLEFFWGKLGILRDFHEPQKGSLVDTEDLVFPTSVEIISQLTAGEK
jgi:hypothetical protein